MTMDQDEKVSRQPGVFITLENIYLTVTSIEAKLDAELIAVRTEISTMKSQLAAQWVIHGILAVVIVGLITKGLRG